MACVVRFQTMDEAIGALGQIDALHVYVALAVDGTTLLNPGDDFFLSPCQVIKKVDGRNAFLYFTSYKVREVHWQALGALGGAHISLAPQLEALTAKMQRRFPGPNVKRVLRKERGGASADDAALYQRTIETCAAVLGVTVPADWPARREAAEAYWISKAAERGLTRLPTVD